MQTTRIESLRQEIEETRAAFHALLASVPETAFALPSDNPAWTVGEVLYHMSIAPRMLVVDAQLFLRGGFLLQLVPKLVPARLFHWLNATLTRRGARNPTHHFLAQAYDEAHAATLQALANVSEADLDRELAYPDWDPLLAGRVTLADLFHYVKRHFEDHAGQIRRQLETLM